MEKNDSGAVIIYQIDSEDPATIPNLLSGSDMTLITLPYALEAGLGYKIIQRQFRLYEATHHSHGPMSTMTPDQIREVVEWFEGIVIVMEPDFP